MVPKLKSLRVVVAEEGVDEDDDDAETGAAGAASSAVAAEAEVPSLVGAAGASAANNDLDLLLPPCWPFWAANELTVPV